MTIDTGKWKVQLTPVNAYRLLALTGLFVLFFFIVFSGIDSYFLSGDESGYFANLELINRFGINSEFLQHFSGMAGPLHPIMHWILQPLTGGIPPGVRIVNFGILLIILWLVRDMQWYRILGIPMTFVCAGYAMTELPAMFFLLLCLLFLKVEKVSYIQIFFAGLCLSLSIAGRWNYLALLPVLYLHLIVNKRFTILKKAVFVLSSLIFPIWILVAWQGITPPEVKGLPGYGIMELNLENFLLSSCFAGMMVIVLAPTWYRGLKLNRGQILILLGFFVVNFLFGFFTFLPAKALFNSTPAWAFLYLGKENWMNILSAIFGSVAITFSIVFFMTMYNKLCKTLNAEKLFYGVSILVVLLTTIKITHTFSSRYPYQILPFLLLLLGTEERRSLRWWELILGLAGMGWGIASWLSYQSIYT